MSSPRIRLAQPAADRLLMPGEAAQRFGVDPKTVARWADDGKLTAIRTPGGQRRYLAGEVDALYTLHQEVRVLRELVDDPDVDVIQPELVLDGGEAA